MRIISITVVQNWQQGEYLKLLRGISLFHRAFFNSIMYKTPTHALFQSTLYYSSVLITLKYTKY